MVIVELTPLISDEELRQLICDMWAIQVSPMLLHIAETDEQELTTLCQRLVETGLVGLLSPIQPEASTQKLWTALDVVCKVEPVEEDSLDWEAVQQEGLRRARALLDG